MYIKVELNEANIKNFSIETFIRDRFTRYDDFKTIPVYPHSDGLVFLIYGKFSDYEYENVLFDLEECGYGLTSESIEKYLNSLEYATDNDKYVVTAELIPYNYEKLYKRGCFVNLNGEQTNKQIQEMPDYKELVKHCEIEGKVIQFRIEKMVFIE